MMSDWQTQQLYCDEDFDEIVRNIGKTDISCI